MDNGKIVSVAIWLKGCQKMHFIAFCLYTWLFISQFLSILCLLSCTVWIYILLSIKLIKRWTQSLLKWQIGFSNSNSNHMQQMNGLVLWEGEKQIWSLIHGILFKFSLSHKLWYCILPLKVRAIERIFYFQTLILLREDIMPVLHHCRRSCHPLLSREICLFFSSYNVRNATRNYLSHKWKQPITGSSKVIS